MPAGYHRARRFPGQKTMEEKAVSKALVRAKKGQKFVQVRIEDIVARPEVLPTPLKLKAASEVATKDVQVDLRVGKSPLGDSVSSQSSDICLLRATPILRDELPDPDMNLYPPAFWSAFTCFGCLPLELRLEIWSMALSSVPRRRIHIYYRKARKPGQRRFASEIKNPTLLAVNRESRAEALGVFHLLLDSNEAGDQAIYFHPDHDTVVFGLIPFESGKYMRKEFNAMGLQKVHHLEFLDVEWDARFSDFTKRLETRYEDAWYSWSFSPAVWVYCPNLRTLVFTSGHPNSTDLRYFAADRTREDCEEVMKEYLDRLGDQIPNYSIPIFHARDWPEDWIDEKHMYNYQL